MFIISEQNTDLWQLSYFADSRINTFAEVLKKIEQAESKIRSYELQLKFQEEREPNSYFEYDKWAAFKWKIHRV